MSEKRFGLIRVDKYVFQIKDNNDACRHLVAEDVVDLLNQLSDENEQLQNENRELHYKVVDLQDKMKMCEKVVFDDE